MDWIFLIVDLGSGELETTWENALSGQNLETKVTYAKTIEDALKAINSGQVALALYNATEKTPQLASIWKSFQQAMGAVAEMQGIICDEPSPEFMAAAYEFGIEQFISKTQWASEAAHLCQEIVAKLNDPQTAEAKAVQLQRSLISGDQAKIEEAKANLGDMGGYDFRVAFAQGKAAEAAGDYNQAIEAFSSASKMNKMFRPTSNSLGESLLITGRLDEAIAVFEKLDKTNPNDIERKTNLAAAFIEKGDFEKAQYFAAQIEKISPGSAKTTEVQAHILLRQGKIAEAFNLLDKMSDVGPYFASKLNDLGIKLSQAGKGKNALALYQKAHKIVRPELRYKISLNAALACRKLQDYDLALKYVQRCEKEFGSLFPKLLKVKQAIMQEKRSAPPAAAAPAAAAESADPLKKAG